MPIIKGRIETIEKGHGDIHIFGRKILKETPDRLFIRNNEAWWKLWKYRQVGAFKIARPHDFKEGDTVSVEKRCGKVVSVQKAVIESPALL